jgi:hypothetical protein
VDALDEEAVESHLDAVVDKAETIDRRLSLRKVGRLSERGAVLGPCPGDQVG